MMVNNYFNNFDFLSVINLDSLYIAYAEDFVVFVILGSLSAITVGIFVVSIWDIVSLSGKKLGDVGKAIITGASAGVANAVGQRILGNGQNNSGSGKNTGNSGGNSGGTNSGTNSSNNSNTNNSGTGNQGK